MKKLLFLVLSMFLLVGCSSGNTTTENTPATSETPSVETTAPATEETVPDRNTTPDGITIVNGEEVDEQLANIAKELYGGLEMEMNYVFYILEPETFETAAFVPYQEGLSGVSADPMIGSIPHSLVLLKVEDDSIDGAALAKQMEENADLNKWICVSAEAKKAIYKDGYIMFVMSDQATVDSFTTTFNNMSLN
ncbi:MAG: hypothetical protein MR210_06335 [Erysipelotrichaceae bacterium]|nr:hypothetical protein [Erysipelotrichaceae bacterium]MDY5251868.1 hypothetical protein [Erysipelotrichaceae bacterium]